MTEVTNILEVILLNHKISILASVGRLYVVYIEIK